MSMKLTPTAVWGSRISPAAGGGRSVFAQPNRSAPPRALYPMISAKRLLLFAPQGLWQRPAICEIAQTRIPIVRFCTMLDWTDLHHFVVLAREGTLSAAARAPGVDHVTIARRVAALEAATALKLVDRPAPRYALTED